MAMVWGTTYLEFIARMIVTSFFRKFIRTGHVKLFEAGQQRLYIFGEEKGPYCEQESSLIINNVPAFYWKVATREALGLADAYIDGDFTFEDAKCGLLNFLLILIANRDLDALTSPESAKKGSWWSPALATSALTSATTFLKHLMRSNSLSNARRNISQHYDLSNDMFSLFLDGSMTYSCAIFKNREESLEDAQLRKLDMLIDKARVESTHEVLDIGCGWGSMAIRVVSRTGCHYTGITLSQQQLDFAQNVVNEANLQDRIRFQLADYRKVEGHHKFDRIISCEMVEHVGHEYLPEWFKRCDHLLAKDGIIVVQSSSLPEQRYDSYRHSTDFIREYIFPGGCAPSFAAFTEAMAAGSSFSLEHMENIGHHYTETLLRWQKKFEENHHIIVDKLGFSEKFMRTWNFYFVYCAAGFTSRTLGCFQAVFTRPGNVAGLGCEFAS